MTPAEHAVAVRLADALDGLGRLSMRGDLDGARRLAHRLAAMGATPPAREAARASRVTRVKRATAVTMVPPWAVLDQYGQAGGPYAASHGDRLVLVEYDPTDHLDESVVIVVVDR